MGTLALGLLTSQGLAPHARDAKTPLGDHGLVTGTIDTPKSDRPQRRGLELVVFERSACGVCTTFRQRLAPAYLEHEWATKVPLRYVDIDGPALGQAGLRTNLAMLPTTVLMQDGREVARVDGLLAPQHFLTIVDGMIRTALPD